MKRKIKYIWAKISYFLLRPVFGKAENNEDVDIYAVKMLKKFNRLHHLIFPRFFSKLRIDQGSLNELKSNLNENTIPIYINPSIGQLEYNFYNYLFLKNKLPLAEFANGLTIWQWMPFKILKKTIMKRLKYKIDSKGFIPHPVSSEYVENLIKNGKSILIRLRTSQIHDDLFWDIPAEDILSPLIYAHENIDKKIVLVPQQFLWAKRPEKTKRSLIDWIFGERDNPGKLRKIILFWRNYKRHALVQFGNPIDLSLFIENNSALSHVELLRKLRKQLLSQLSLERKRITGPALKPRKWIIEHIVEDDNVGKQIYSLAIQKRKDIEELKLLATKYAQEITADINYSYIEFATRLLNWAFNNMYDGIHCEPKDMQNIKNLAKKHPLVFVPNHRSHVDYLLLSNLLYGNDIVVPHVAAGNNLAFWPLGNIFRHTGAFFIRRTFSGNKLYRTVLEAYLRLLLREGYSLEFFIEGGRSRTGKLRQPKLGMLKMLTEAMFANCAKDLIFIPTSITYDKVAEESSYVDESAGKDKPKEKFFDIFKLRKYLKHRYGKIYVNFADPIFFSEISKSIENRSENNETISKIISSLAYNISNSINSKVIVTPQSLVSTALLVEPKKGIASEQISNNIDNLLNYLEQTQVTLSESIHSDKKKSIAEVIHQLTSQKFIQMHDDFDPVYYSILEGNRINLNYHKNSILHFFLPISYVSAALLNMLNKKEVKFNIQKVSNNIRTLHKLFTNAFAAHAGLVNNEKIEQAFEYLTKQNAIEILDKDIKIKTLGPEILKFYSSLITNQIDSFKIAYYTCSKLTEKSSVDEKNLIKNMLKNGEHLLTLGKITYPESINKPSFEEAITYFKCHKLLVNTIENPESEDKKKYRWDDSSEEYKSFQELIQLFI